MTAGDWRAVVGRRVAVGARWDAGFDPIVRAAVDMLVAYDFQTPDLGWSRVAVGVLGDAEGRINRRGRITIAADGDAYRYALEGDLRPLAGVVLHEEVHYARGNEKSALTTELEFLNCVGAPAPWRQFVESLLSQQSTAT